VGFEFMLSAYGSIMRQPMLDRKAKFGQAYGQYNPMLWRDWAYHSFRARVPETEAVNAFSSRGLFVVCVRGCGDHGDIHLHRRSHCHSGPASYCV
jgi:hypothetical protein